MNSVFRSAPPNATLLMWSVGSRTRASSAPLSGSWQLTLAAPQCAIHSRPAASVVMPSGKPSPRSKRRNSRDAPSVPLDGSKANACTLRRTVSLKNIVRPSSDQVGPLLTAKPASKARTQRPGPSKRYSAPVGARQALSIVPPQKRPRASHLPSLNRLAVLSGSGSSSRCSVPVAGS